MEKPDVDRIEGIAPSIAIRQKNSIRNPRSTVGTVTEIHDYMRLLFARVGRTFCRSCGVEVVRETAEVVSRRLVALPEDTRLLVGFDMPVLAPATAAAPSEDDEAEEPADSQDDLFGEAVAVKSAPTPAMATVDTLRRKGFGRLLVEGRATGFEDLTPGEIDGASSLAVLVDRVVVNPDARTRITDSIETAYQEGGGAAWVVQLGVDGAPDVRHAFSERFECRTCNLSYEDPQPRLFPSTTRSARAPPATGSATSSSSTSIWSCRTRPSPSRKARSSRGRSRTTARTSATSRRRRRCTPSHSTSPGRI
jgi:excinuclease ABC subunit A